MGCECFAGQTCQECALEIELTRLRAELAEAQRHAKVLAKACCGLMNNGKPDCKDHELRDALIHVKGIP